MKLIRKIAAWVLKDNVLGYCMQQDMDSGWIYGEGWHLNFGRGTEK